MGSTLKLVSRRSDRPTLYGKIAIAVFVVVQILDGVLTYRGMSVWGLDVEANPLVSWVMLVVGVGLGLISAKLVAIGLGVFVYWHGYYNIVAFFATVYMVIAVFPWAYLFLTL